MSKDPISIVQRGNLQSLERTLRKQWRLGQSIVLSWCWDERGLLVIFVPHYFLGNYCARRDDPEAGGENENYVRALISGRRRKSRDELFAAAVRLGVAPTFIKLEHPLDESIAVMGAVEEIIRRYGLSFVERRAVLLFDVTDFSLFSSFEQASQLNSLSYSMNSAYNKLSGRGVEINFARTTTGDGYYVWNRDNHPRADEELFLFLLLVLADNSLARAASRGNTVPVIRAAFHIGSHYELYQAEGVNPTVFSYIVGDVTIELARIIEKSLPRQVMLGDFGARLGEDHGTAEFVRSCTKAASALEGLALMGKPLRSLHCWLSREESLPGSEGDAPNHAVDTPRAGAEHEHEKGPLMNVSITDKHGLQHRAFNLQAELLFDSSDLALGLTPQELRLGHAKARPQRNGQSDGWWV